MIDTHSHRLARCIARWRRFPISPLVSMLAALALLAVPPIRAGTWTPLSNQAPGAIGLMLLLSDGTVMAKSFNGGGDSYGNTWYRLTPDSTGSYVHGTWTALAPMQSTRLYFPSQVLVDGRVFVCGGEYGNGMLTGETYNPLTDSWTEAPSPGVQFSDSCSEILPNGNVMVAVLQPPYTATEIFNPTSNAWSAGPSTRGPFDESAWVKLPDDSILFVDLGSTNAERYIPAQNSWITDGTTPVSLYDTGSECGPGVLLPNGKVIEFGGTGATAIYTPSGSTANGSWVVGPTIPNGQGMPDAPCVLMPNGNVLMAVCPVAVVGDEFQPPTTFYEYNYTTNSYASEPTPTGGVMNYASFQGTMLSLPDGTALYSNFSSQIYSYQSGGSPVAGAQPTITSITQNGDGSYHLTGTQLNGISEASEYGDDNQNATNYPIVRLTSGNKVYYARTYNWSRTSVATGATPVSTEFAVPPTLPAGSYSLVVVANGIASAPVSFPPLNYSLGVASLLEGPAGGSDSVLLTETLTTASWTTVANAPWLHVSASGAGSATIIFNFDANSGGARTGTLTIAGQTLTITQAGSTYVPAGVVSLVSSGLSAPVGLALNASGDLYIADPGSQSVKLWKASTQAVTTLFSDSQNSPDGVAVDSSGNVYTADSDVSVKLWLAATGVISTPVPLSPSYALNVTLDDFGTLFVATGNSVASQSGIVKWSPAFQSVTPVVSGTLNNPQGVAVDASGNVYISDSGNNMVKKWTAATQTLSTLVPTGLNNPRSVAVDGSGNVYIADSNNNFVKKWSAASNSVSTVVTPALTHPSGVAVDGSGNVFIADSGHGLIDELPRAFLDPTPISETAGAGSDLLPSVLPSTQNLLPPFAPTSDQSWLIIGSVSGGVVHVFFTANATGSPRTGHITLLGQQIPISQPALAPANLAYANNPTVYTKGVSVAANTPHNTGGAIMSYSVSPDLPAGLILNTTTGVVTGVPTAITATAAYTVTATNTGGSTTASLTITVNDVAPSSLTYATNLAVYTKGSAISADNPSNAGGVVISYSVSPPLPSGLTLDPATGILNGAPAVIAAAANYTVTAANTGGTATTTLNITVNDTAPTALIYAANPAAYPVSAPITSNAPSNTGGTVVSYSVSPSLPPGLTLDPATGLLRGTPTALAAAASYTVTATNTGGSATVSLRLSVVDVPPVAAAQTLHATTHLPLAITLSGTQALNESLSYAVATQPLHGALGGTAPHLTYTSVPTFVGDDTFTFQATSSGGTSAPATVTIVVSPPTSKKGYYSGHYIGLVSGADPAHSGTVRVTSLGTGAFTGSITFGGVTRALKGSFDSQGRYPINILRKGLPSLTGMLSFGLPYGPDVITGTFDGSTLVAGYAAYSASEPPPQAGRYTVQIPPDPTQTDGSSTPQGYGVGTLVVGKTGSIMFAGALADGTKLSQGTSLTIGAVWYLFAPLYATTGPAAGMLEGTIQFERMPGVSDLDGAITWIRPRLAKTPPPAKAFYPGGFNLATQLYGATYNPKSSLVVTPSSPNNTFHAQGGSISGGLTEAVTAGKASAAISLKGSNNLSLSVKTATGFIKGSLTESTTSSGRTIRLSLPVNAVIYQNGLPPSIVGWFTEEPTGGPNEGGAVEVTSP